MPAPPRTDDAVVSTTQIRAFLLMAVSAMTGPAMQATVRVAAADVHIFEIVFLRNLMAIAIVAPILLRHGLAPLRTRRPGLHLIRGSFQVAAMMMGWYALTLIGLAEFTALTFSVPVFASIGAILFLGERSYIQRWATVTAGLIGMAIIVRPGFATIDFGITLTLVATVLFAVTRLFVKELTKTDSAPTVVFYLALTSAPISFVPAFFVWTWPPIETWGLLILVAALGTTTHLLSTQSYREGDVTALEPMNFTRLIWAAFIGYFLFGELPIVWTWIGSGLIVVSTTLLVRFEARRPAHGAAVTGQFTG